MRRAGGALRGAVAGGLVVAPVLLSAAPAAAATDVELVVDASAWSWRRLAPAPVPEPSGVPTGSLAVAFDGQPGTASKATYLRLALGGLPAGASLSQLDLVVPVDVAESDDPTTAPVVACRLAAPFPTGEGVDPATMPAEDCTDAQPARYDATASALVVDLTAAGRAWLSGAANTGVVLRPPTDVSLPDALPYQLVLQGATSVVGRASVTVPPEPAPSVDPAPPPPVVPLAPGVALPPVFSGEAAPPALGPAPAPAPSAAPAPVAAPRTPAAPALARRPVAATGASASGFAAAVLGGLALLVAAGWSLGDTTGLRAFARGERARRDRLRQGALVVPAAVPVPAQPVAGRQTRQGRRPLSSAASTLT